MLMREYVFNEVACHVHENLNLTFLATSLLVFFQDFG